MRVEPFGVGSVIHVVKRGTRGMEIVRDDADRWRFVRILYMLNDLHQAINRLDHTIDKEVHKSDLCTYPSLFFRPAHWPERGPLVSILAWTLMPNHIHLLLQETREGGVSKFLQRLFGSMTTAFNEKYQEKGSIFQGPYKSRTIDTESYLNHVVPYIAVKNVLELYPGGLQKAIREYDSAWQWAREYPFTSFQTHAFGSTSPIVDVERLQSFGLPTGDVFKRFSHDMLMTHMSSRDLQEESAHIFLEDW